jgi:ligand-binding sensor domain-containing protein
MSVRIILTGLLLNLFLHLYASDTLLVGIKDFGTPIRSMVQNEEGKIFIQLGNQVFKFINEKLVKTNLKISADDEIFLQNGKFTSINTLIKSKVKIQHSQNHDFNWNKYLAKTGTENVGICFKDRQNNYWVSNGSKFLYKFIITDFFERDLKQFSIRGILMEGTDLYVNSYSGFFKNGVKIGPDILSGGSNIFKKDNKLYLAGIRKLYTLDLITNEFNLIFQDSLSKSIGEISCVFYFENKWWLGGSNGLFYLINKDKLAPTPVSDMVNNFKIIEDNLYILGGESLYIFQNGRFRNMKRLPSNMEYNDLVKTSKYYYVATAKGLFKLDSLNGKLINCFESTIYENEEFFSLALDEFNFLWVGSKVGLIRLNTVNESFDLFLKDLEFNKRSSFNKDNKFYFGTTDGYITFSPKSFFSSEWTSKYEFIKENSLVLYKYLLAFALLIILILIIYINKKPKIHALIRPPSSIYMDTTEEMVHEGIGKYSMNNIEYYIIEHINTINVDKLREDSGLTKNVFYKVFNQHYDIAPKQLIEIIREERINSRKKSQRRE